MDHPRYLSVFAFLAGALLSAGCGSILAEGEEPSPNAPRGSAQPRTITERILGSSSSSRRDLPAGTRVEVRLLQDVDSGTANVGDNVDASVVQAIAVDDAIVIPSGARVRGEVDAVQSAKHFGGKAMVSVRFMSIEVPGFDIEVTGSMSTSAQGQKGRDTAIIAGSAAGGAILGKVIGGDDKDAVAGAVVGGGIGTAVASRKGDEALLAAGTTTTVTTNRDETLRRVD